MAKTEQRKLKKSKEKREAINTRDEKKLVLFLPRCCSIAWGRHPLD